ncbi:hypothetical protein FOZ61_009671 [Perkinsus olseni]|uniref:Cysteine protease n=1 Tax=Perkinsus olseni TaxID=32597 RepID=A0A7J6KZV9_PEROL|nr:hypothetical protein FOZ61_009671 [Perkinsus olseni]
MRLKGFTVFVALTILQALPSGALSEQKIDQAFADFIVNHRYQKEYHSEAEHSRRRGLFAKTLRDVVAANEEHNEKSGIGSKYVANINAFADLSAEEFAAGLLCGHTMTPTIPLSIEQFVFLAAVVEGRFQIKTGIKPLIPFSVQQIVDCSTSYGSKGCKGGTLIEAWMYVQDQGIVKESAYPYTAKDGKCQHSVVTSQSNQCLAARDVVGWIVIKPEDELILRGAVADGPVSVGIHGSSSRFRNYRFGVMTTKECGEGNLDHGVTIIVGYGRTPESVTYWKILNSWGPSWGEDGIGYVERITPGYPREACAIMKDHGLLPKFADNIKASACIKR